MGSSDDPNSNTQSIDASVGGLVWVRRRNGSWWPGRIMGLDEISEGSLVSPRSGTPVKLLGREDASVDWYNLEKSKRVKAFRCGEYDECIEKAKASAANGNKKVVKYARREDAILHALEIENARLGKDHVDFFSGTHKSGGENGGSDKDLHPSVFSKEDVDVTEEESDSKDESDSDSGSGSGSGSGSAQEFSQSGVSFEESNHFGASKVQSAQGKRRRTPNDSEDDGTEGIKRMRGLEDLGMVIGDSSAGNCVPNGSPINGSKVYNPSMKRKRSQVANVHEFLKRKNRRRPLTKVLESTAMVSVPVICDQLPNSNGSPLQGVSDGRVSGIDSNESRKSFCVPVNNNSDSTGISCENGASLNPPEHVCDASQFNYKLKMENDVTGGASGFADNDASDELFDVPFVGEAKQSAGFSPAFVSSGRNQVGVSGRQSSQSSQAEAVSLKNERLNESVSISSAAVHVSNISQRMEKDTSKWQLKGKRNSRHQSKNRKEDKRKYMVIDNEPGAYLPVIEHSDGFFPCSDQSMDCDGNRRPLQVEGVRNWSKSFSHRSTGGATAEVSLLPQRLLPYRQSRFTVNSRYPTTIFPGRNTTDSKLYEVKVEVKANYQPQNVPLVSLMSKFNGKAIIGRPLTVEVLDDGYCDRIISSNESAMEATEPGHETARNSEAGRIPAKHTTTQPRFSPSKRKSGFLSKKTRKLSSLTGNKEEHKKLEVEKLKDPVISCIPLKLVFSRITEAVNGSARQTRRVPTLSNS